MGTNFYLKKLSVCPHCGNELSSPESEPAEGLHIGKSSAGWCFSLHVYPDGKGEHQIKDLPDWIPLFEKYGVIDEYGRERTVTEMVDVITKRSHPKGLNRHVAEQGRCLGPGEGTWDLLIGEFS
jgi:hypothetical protein